MKKLFLIIILITFGCHDKRSLIIPPPVDKNAPVYSALFQHMIEIYKGYREYGPINAFYIGIKNKAPTTAIFESIHSDSIPLKPCTLSVKEGYILIDKITRKEGLLLNIDTIIWLNDSSVTVEAGYYMDGKSASGDTYSLRLRDGFWIVIGKKEKWVS